MQVHRTRSRKGQRFGKQALSNQAQHDAGALAPGQVARTWAASLRFLRELAARLKAFLWFIVAVSAIMLGLVLLGGLPPPIGLLGLLCFTALVAMLPRQGSDQAIDADLTHPAADPPLAASMQVMGDALPDPVILLNASGQVRFLNAPARGLFATLREGSHISSVIRTPEFLDAVSQAPERGRAVTVTYAERVPVGRRMAATVAPLARDLDQTSDILVLLRDLTEGERINQMRADFIANASHELRTPLASLRGFIETLQGAPRETQARRSASSPSWPSRPRA